MSRYPACHSPFDLLDAAMVAGMLLLMVVALWRAWKPPRRYSEADKVNVRLKTKSRL